jgi:hypothetical protein
MPRRYEPLENSKLCLSFSKKWQLHYITPLSGVVQLTQTGFKTLSGFRILPFCGCFLVTLQLKPPTPKREVMPRRYKPLENSKLCLSFSKKWQLHYITPLSGVGGFIVKTKKYTFVNYWYSVNKYFDSIIQLQQTQTRFKTLSGFGKQTKSTKTPLYRNLKNNTIG